MKERVVMTQDQVLTWLKHNMPALAKYAEPDRQWIWLAVDLKGCGKSRRDKPCPCSKCTGMKAVRDKIKGIGFTFASGHPLPSGRTGRWLHPCDGPKPFRPWFRKSGNADRKAHQSVPEAREAQQNPAPAEPVVAVDPEFMKESAALFDNL